MRDNKCCPVMLGVSNIMMREECYPEAFVPLGLYWTCYPTYMPAFIYHLMSSNILSMHHMFASAEYPVVLMHTHVIYKDAPLTCVWKLILLCNVTLGKQKNMDKNR